MGRKGMTPIILVPVGLFFLFFLFLLAKKTDIIPTTIKTKDELKKTEEGINIKYFDKNGNPIKPKFTLIPPGVFYITFETTVKNTGNIVSNETIYSAAPTALYDAYLNENQKIILQKNQTYIFKTESPCTQQSDCNQGEVCIGSNPTCKIPKKTFYTHGFVVRDLYTKQCSYQCPSNVDLCVWRHEDPSSPPLTSGLLIGGTTTGESGKSTSQRCFVKGYYPYKYSIETLVNYDNNCAGKSKTECQSPCCWVGGLTGSCSANCYRTFTTCPTQTPSGKYVDFCLTHDPSNGDNVLFAYLGYDHALKPGEVITDYFDRVDAITLTCEDITFSIDIESIFRCPTNTVPCRSPIGNISAGAIGTYRTTSSKELTICPNGGGE